MTPSSRIVALICAAGVGARMGYPYPKQYHRLLNEPILTHTVNALLGVERIEEVVVVVQPNDPWIEEVAARWPQRVTVLPVGGPTRAESVRAGLMSLVADENTWVLVHDAARPCVKPAEVAHLLDAVLTDAQVDGGILAIEVADTLKRANDQGYIEATVSRERMWRALTPQLFKAQALYKALSGDLNHITDEASAMERIGARIKLVKGRATNIKVTTPGDDEMAERFLSALPTSSSMIIPSCENTMPALRIGQGYDSHRLVEGRPLIIGGVEIPFEKGLDGHSDADVLLHAITDAILGALSLGDIGTHFPPSDEKWKGADSAQLLSAVMQLVHQKGWRVGNLDATVVAERPKFGPYKATIQARVAQLLEVEPDCVSIKAKTNEKMDAVGRQEGMVAYASVLLMKA